MNDRFRAILQRISEALGSWVPAETISTVFGVILILAIGSTLVKLVHGAVHKLARRSLPARTALIMERVVKYGGALAVILAASRKAGVDISAFLGAAGIAGIALGFAAQTSVSNLISGLFLFSEKSFRTGDTIQFGDVLGVVEGIDLLAARIRTFDNRLVRVPNETLIKSNIVNVTYYPTRRLDLWITLPFGTDVGRAMSALREAIGSTPLVLADPEPVVMVDPVTTNGIPVLAGAWFRKEDLVAVKNGLIPACLAALARIGVTPASQRIELAGGALPGAADPAGQAAGLARDGFMTSGDGSRRPDGGRAGDVLQGQG